ncbi:Hsp20/alpha crystallin family protein [Halovivax limisalsi]|uniref:Hsp20/alpha crystallin family protein n=1 Tax=Halovivax limisalsi TaxID=1453760 RepID=UPI001FFD4402|nr:Hsp20/alpha crystallin family protein [Halovivax limisalsi]
MFDSPEELTILADLPGCTGEDVKVRTSNNTLYITAERSADIDGDSQPVMHERADRIERSIPLPADIEAEEADASCENGVCRITLPKKEESKQREIGIH